MKKILVLFVGVLLSFSASASYTQYNFSDTGSDVQGFFIQRDDNEAIAMYSIRVFYNGRSTLFQTFPEGANITSAYNNFSGAGPTSFSVFNDLGGSYFESLVISFEADNPAYGFHAGFTQEREPTTPPSVPVPTTPSYFDIVTKGTVDPYLAAQLDADGGYYGGINRITPAIRLPEPASLGLFAIGALGAFGAARRRKAQR